MPDFDLIVRSGSLVLAEGVLRADLAVAGGRIAAIQPGLDATAAHEMDAAGLHVFPGGVDPHVHMNEPGRAHWEGFSHGTAALAAGGFTTFLDMPLNSLPVTVDAESFDLKLAVAEATCLVDFGLLGGLVPGRVDRLEELVERGAAGFKAFMCPSGIDEFPAADDLTLYEGMRRCAGLGAIVLVHAENAGITGELARRAVAGGLVGARDFLASRPAVAELEAVSRALTFAGETGCRLHVVHVSTAAAARLVARALAQGADVSCETCPHYLVLGEEDLEELGALAKCAPPLRAEADREGLWRLIAEGVLPIVGSDHSPAPPELKRGADWFALWGGIAGCQTTLRLLLAHGHARRGLDLQQIAALTAANAARRFRLPAKGVLAPGGDADLVLVDLSDERPLTAAELHYRHPQSPFVGQLMRGRVVRTLLRGTTVWEEGRVVAPRIGRLVRPER